MRVSPSGGVWKRPAKAALSIFLLATLAYAIPTLVRAAPPAPGSVIFEQKCKACHTIGGGRLAGPDLKGVTAKRDRDWLIEWIVSPKQVLAQGDPLAKQLVQEYGSEMPGMGLSREEAEEVISYIKEQSGAAEGKSAAPSQTQASDLVGDAALGRDLFTGKTPLSNGGVACISCHNIKDVGGLGGGSVGKDLTTAYSNYGEDGLRAMLKTPPFPIMKEVFTEHPLTEAEIEHLVAFFREEGVKTVKGQSSLPILFLLLGLGGSLLGIGLFQLIWRRQLQGVRQPLVRGGSK